MLLPYLAFSSFNMKLSIKLARMALQAGSDRFQVVVLLVILLDLLLDTLGTVTVFVPVKQCLDAVIQRLALFCPLAGFAL